jgi:SAM-dependent methyltransferase
MSDPTVSKRPDYFAMVYGANADPWGFESSPYEDAKYDATLAALPKPRYERGFEIGCSIGVLTERLARRCDRLLAVDVVPDVLERARARCRELPQLRFARMELPGELPDEQFDLIVLSEVAYYWSVGDLARARIALAERLLPGGQLILVHWTPSVHDYPQTGDQVHDAFMEDARPAGNLQHLLHQREETYRLDLFERRATSTRNS